MQWICSKCQLICGQGTTNKPQLLGTLDNNSAHHEGGNPRTLSVSDVDGNVEVCDTPLSFQFSGNINNNLSRKGDIEDISAEDAVPNDYITTTNHQHRHSTTASGIQVTEPNTVLPPFNTSHAIPSVVKWGKFTGVDIATKLEQLYDKIIKWKFNLFKLPSGAHGKAFITEITRLIDLWANKTSLESVALLALHIFAPIMLQKPSRTSKNRDHIKYLGERLDKWNNGLFDDLLYECEAIQMRLPQNSKSQNPDHVKKVFSRLMLQGKVSAALRWITSNNSKPLEVTPNVIATLNSKHPDAAEPIIENLITGEIPRVESVIFENIDADIVFKSAKITKGSAGPSGLDSDIWRRILCSKSFGKVSEDACESVARMCRRLCTEYVDPMSIEALLNCRLIPLDKNPGIRPIGVGEVLRRIIGKSVVMFLKPDIINSVGPLQLSAGQDGGCEAACHAMSRIFTEDECQGVLLVDATNAFNSLNRRTALLNIRYTCPNFSKYLINTYRKPAKLFLPGGTHITSKEGTTQGDNCASGFYSVSTMILIKELSEINGCKQIWYADDGGSGGKLAALKQWWDQLLRIGPTIGYFPNPTKTWLVVKSQYLSEARTLFADTGIRITEEGLDDDGETDGQRYLGAAIGSVSFIHQYVRNKVRTWVRELEDRCDLGKTEPQLAYAAYTMGLCKRWTYVMRTIPNISDLFAPLENCIRSKFLPILLGSYQFDDLDRKIYSLPTRFGGLAILNPIEMCELILNTSTHLKLQNHYLMPSSNRSAH